MSHEELVNRLIQEGYLKTPIIIDAFREVDRADFMPENVRYLAYENKLAPIGWEQTISQPSVVAFMLELLQPKPGDRTLDIGSGSGYTTTLLAKTVGDKGKVIAVEVIPELHEFGAENAAKYGIQGIAELICADASAGWEKDAPYDTILVSAEARKLPKELWEQLKVGGRIVIPIGNSVWLFIKKSETELDQEEHPNYIFVPLLNEKERIRNKRAREFLDEHPLHRDVLVTIIGLTLNRVAPTVVILTEAINQGLSEEEGQTPCTNEQVAEAISHLEALEIIAQTWVPAVSLGEIVNLIGSETEKLVASEA